MIYPKDNNFTVSGNIHSLGLQNNMTTGPTFGSPMFLTELIGTKQGLTAGAQKMTRKRPSGKCGNGVIVQGGLGSYFVRR
jgi:hypothetical protein